MACPAQTRFGAKERLRWQCQPTAKESGLRAPVRVEPRGLRPSSPLAGSWRSVAFRRIPSVARHRSRDQTRPKALADAVRAIAQFGVSYTPPRARGGIASA